MKKKGQVTPSRLGTFLIQELRVGWDHGRDFWMMVWCRWGEDQAWLEAERWGREKGVQVRVVEYRDERA